MNPRPELKPQTPPQQQINPQLFSAINNVVSHAMATNSVNLWESIQFLMQNILVPVHRQMAQAKAELEAKAKKEEEAKKSKETLAPEATPEEETPAEAPAPEETLSSEATDEKAPVLEEVAPAESK